MTGQAEDRIALRVLMSELSEDAYCAGWHIDTEYRLWEMLVGERRRWMGLSVDDPRIEELRRLHVATGGWWRFNPELNDGCGDQEFVATEAWGQLYVRTVNDRERSVFAVIGGKILRGQNALDASARVLRPYPKKPGHDA